MKALSVDEHRVTSADGTEIAYYTVGEGPPVLLLNGLGGSWVAWSHQIRYFEQRYRFVSWDYRGLYASAVPSLDALGIERHVEDALAVLQAEGIERVALMGWSMGVQVALELFSREPELASSLVLVNGVAGSPWSTVLNLSVMGELLPPLIRGVGSVPRLAEAVVRRAATMPELARWAKRVGLASKTLDEDIWARLAASFAELDMGVYLRILDEIGAHDAHGVLAEVDVPTLVVAGDRDLFTPKSAAERIARRIAGAELMVVPGGTHYVAVEYPELVNLRIEKHFQERGWASS